MSKIAELVRLEALPGGGGANCVQLTPEQYERLKDKATIAQLLEVTAAQSQQAARAEIRRLLVLYGLDPMARYDFDDATQTVTRTQGEGFAR